MTTIPKTCEQCKKPFEAKLHRAKFCSGSCRASAGKKKQLGNAHETITHTPMKTETKTVLPPGLDLATKWAFDQAQDQIKTLRTDLKENSIEVKTLQAEREKLKEEIATLKAEVGAKPTGLNGFLSNNPTFAEKAMELFGPKLISMIEKLEPRQLGGGDHPVWQWITVQSEPVQAEFVSLIEGLNQNPEKILENLAQFKRSLMATDSKQVIQQRFGRG